MVGLVIVSHSAALADGVVELAREMGAGEVQIEAAGGIEDGALGTDAARVQEAVERVRSPDGVLVLMDLGSALMSAEMAAEMAGPDGGPIVLSEAPLVEGAVAAAARARGGGTLDEVAREARGALAVKSTQLGGDEPEAAPDRPGHEGDDVQELRLVVDNRLGLHARPAARFVGDAHQHQPDGVLRCGRAPVVARRRVRRWSIGGDRRAHRGNQQPGHLSA